MHVSYNPACRLSFKGLAALRDLKESVREELTVKLSRVELSVDGAAGGPLCRHMINQMTLNLGSTRYK